MEIVIKTIVKSDKESENCRKKANEFYANWDLNRALLNYKLAIYHAQTKENRMKAFANRSVLLFHLWKYTDCIEDIKAAKANGLKKNKKNDKFYEYERNAKEILMSMPPMALQFANLIQVDRRDKDISGIVVISVNIYGVKTRDEHTHVVYLDSQSKFKNHRHSPKCCKAKAIEENATFTFRTIGFRSSAVSKIQDARKG